MINGLYFVAMNNSRRIEILDPVTFKSVGNIRYKESGSPRFITPLSDSTAFVSDLHGQLVVIRTKPPHTETEYMQLPLKPAAIEKMTTTGGKVFGAYLGKGLAVFDCDDYSVRNMRLIEDVVVGELTKTCIMPVDARGRLWVLTIPERVQEQTHLTLTGNNLSGELPAEMATMPMLSLVYLSGNRFTGDAPAFGLTHLGGYKNYVLMPQQDGYGIGR